MCPGVQLVIVVQGKHVEWAVHNESHGAKVTYSQHSFCITVNAMYCIKVQPTNLGLFHLKSYGQGCLTPLKNSTWGWSENFCDSGGGWSGKFCDSVGGWSFSTFCNRKSTKNVKEIMRLGGPKKFAILQGGTLQKIGIPEGGGQKTLCKTSPPITF